MNSTIGIVGVKLGMTRVFKEAGASIPVTVIHAQPNRICQIKLKKKDGYDAVQVAAGEQKPQRLSKALRGHYAKARVTTGRCLIELRVTTEQAQDLSSMTQLDVSQFVEGQRVDLIGRSKGKGFSGAIKRWNFSSQDASHGNSISHRHLGSTGQCQFPGKVWKGKKMAGQYGNKRSTIMRLEVVAIDEEKDLLLVKGAVPGAEGRLVVIRPSHKETTAERERIEELRQAKAQQQEAAEQQEEQEEQQEQPEETKAEGAGEGEVKEEQTPESQAQEEEAKQSEETKAEEAGEGEVKEEQTPESQAQEEKTKQPEEKQEEEKQAEEGKETKAKEDKEQDKEAKGTEKSSIEGDELEKAQNAEPAQENQKEKDK